MRRKLTSSNRYGEEVEVENQTRNEGTHTYDVTTLLAEFTFRYRPLGAISTYLLTLYRPKISDVLQRAGIAPQEFLAFHLNLSPLSTCTCRHCNAIPTIPCTVFQIKENRRYLISK